MNLFYEGDTELNFGTSRGSCPTRPPPGYGLVQDSLGSYAPVKIVRFLSKGYVGIVSCDIDIDCDDEDDGYDDNDDDTKYDNTD